MNSKDRSAIIFHHYGKGNSAKEMATWSRFRYSDEEDIQAVIDDYYREDEPEDKPWWHPHEIFDEDELAVMVVACPICHVPSGTTCEHDLERRDVLRSLRIYLSEDM